MNFTLLQSQNTKKIVMENILDYKNNKIQLPVTSREPESQTPTFQLVDT